MSPNVADPRWYQELKSGSPQRQVVMSTTFLAHFLALRAGPGAPDHPAAVRHPPRGAPLGLSFHHVILLAMMPPETPGGC
jgi:hypothetical protein